MEQKMSKTEVENFVKNLENTSLFDDAKGMDDLKCGWPLALCPVRNTLLALGYNKEWLDTELIKKIEKIYMY